MALYKNEWTVFCFLFFLLFLVDSSSARAVAGYSFQIDAAQCNLIGPCEAKADCYDLCVKQGYIRDSLSARKAFVTAAAAAAAATLHHRPSIDG